MLKHTKEEEEVLVWLKKMMKISLSNPKAIIGNSTKTNSYIIDDEKFDNDQDDWLNGFISRDKLEELEKANSLIYAKAIIYSYDIDKISKKEVIELFECFWGVVLRKRSKEEYEKLTNGIQIMSIEITRNLLSKNKIEEWSFF